MSRLRSSITLLGICVVALVIGGLRLLTERTPLPVGSSYSAQPDGALGVYAWFDALGGRTLRLRDLVLDESQPASLVVVPGHHPPLGQGRVQIDHVRHHGGAEDPDGEEH